MIHSVNYRFASFPCFSRCNRTPGQSPNALARHAKPRTSPRLYPVPPTPMPCALGTFQRQGCFSTASTAWWNSYTSFKTQLRHHPSCHSRLLFQTWAPTAPLSLRIVPPVTVWVSISPPHRIAQDSVRLVSVAPVASTGPGPPRSALIKVRGHEGGVWFRMQWGSNPWLIY